MMEKEKFEQAYKIRKQIESYQDLLNKVNNAEEFEIITSVTLRDSEAGFRDSCNIEKNLPQTVINRVKKEIVDFLTMNIKACEHEFNKI